MVMSFQDELHRSMLPRDGDIDALRKANPYAVPRAKSRMPSNADLLRRGLARQLEREPSSIGKADPGHRVDLGEVKTTRHGVVSVAHDIDQGALVMHGIAVALDEIDADLRSLFLSSSATLNSVQDRALQSQRALPSR